MLDYQREFYANSSVESISGRNKALVFGDGKDAAKTWHFADVLRRQHIEFHPLSDDIRLDGKDYKKGYGYVIPKNQKNYQIYLNIFLEKIREDM